MKNWEKTTRLQLSTHKEIVDLALDGSCGAIHCGSQMKIIDQISLSKSVLILVVHLALTDNLTDSIFCAYTLRLKFRLSNWPLHPMAIIQPPVAFTIVLINFLRELFA